MAEKRLIYADEIEDLFYKQVEWGATDLMGAFDDALNGAQTVDAVEVVHGRWDAVCEYEDFLYAHCSVCGKRSEYMTNFCGNCGAKMDGDGNG